MCRNHRGFIETVGRCPSSAPRPVLNTAFAAPQFAEVSKREKAVAIIYDQEFCGLLDEARKRRKRFIAWHDEEKLDDPTLEDLIAAATRADALPPEKPGRTIILTSGTTGTPKGASRSQPETARPGRGAALQDPADARARSG